MSLYRRDDTPGATWFFTVVTYRRREFLCDEVVRNASREAITLTRSDLRVGKQWNRLPTLHLSLLGFEGPSRGLWRVSGFEILKKVGKEDRKMKKALLVLVASIWLSGCALTTDKIDLAYVPQGGVSAVPGANDVVVNVNVNDQRQEKSNKVSSKKNGFGMEMAPILANEDVPVTLRRAIEQELQSRGFKIGNEALVSVVADLTRFWNDHKVGFWSSDAVADLNMSVLVKSKSGNILYSRNITTQGIEPNNQLMTGENARLALDKALVSGMKMLFEDPAFIAALLEVSKKSAS